MQFIMEQWFTFHSFVLFVIGAIAAIFGVLLGAAGFILLPAMLMVGVPIHTTIAVNKFATGVSSFVSVLSLLIKGQIKLKTMFPFMMVAAIGGVVGAFISANISENTLNIIACIILAFAFLIVLKQQFKRMEIADSSVAKKISRLPPFFIGMYDGAIGPGSGSMNISYFLKANYPYLKAVQLTRFMMFSSCMSAFFFYLLYGVFDVIIAVPITIGSIVGTQLALKIAPYLKSRWLQMVLPVLFFFLFIQMLKDVL